MMSSMNDVTVVIPIHREGNREWLAQAIASIPAGAKYLVMENDGELADSLNKGIREADTEFVFIMGADDVLGEGCIELLRSLIWNVDIAYPSMLLVSEDMRHVFGEHRADPFCPNRLKVWNYVPGVFLARRERLIGAGLYRDLDSLEDWDYHLTCAKAGLSFKPVPEAKYLYRQVSNSRNKTQLGPLEVREKYRPLISGDVKLDATFYAQATPVTTYWRCQLPARYVNGQSVTEFPLAYQNEDQVVFPDHHGTAVFQFPGDEGRQNAMRALQEHGVKCLVEVDDNYLIDAGRITRRANWVKSIRDEHLSPHSIERHIQIVRDADGVITTTEWLADQYRRYNRNVFVCPNQLAPEDWPEPLEKDPSVFRIGWFASVSHRADSDLVIPALRWAAAQPGVEVVLMGVGGTVKYEADSSTGKVVSQSVNHWKEFRGFPHRYIPNSNDLATYHKMLTSLDVGLAPVKPGRWASGRSDLKALEYAFAGACPVLSDAPPYSGWKHREGCLKAKGTHGFLDAVKALVKDKAMARELAAESVNLVVPHRTMGANAWRWQEAIR